MVKDMGFRVLSAHSAEEGLTVFTTEQPAVVILDVGLPDQSGLQVFQRLQQIDARVPVIFITGAGTTATAIDAMSLGAFDYVLKPLDFKALIALIGRALDVARLMRSPELISEDGRRAGNSGESCGSRPSHARRFTSPSAGSRPRT